MQIDDRVEPLVRDALDAAVAQDLDRLGVALKAFPDNDARRNGLELALAISSVALFDRYEGRPSPDQVREAADAICERAGWSRVSPAEAEGYLTSLVEGTPLEFALDARDMVPLIFIITATLLAASPRVRDGGSWAAYLDQIETVLATPETGG